MKTSFHLQIIQVNYLGQDFILAGERARVHIIEGADFVPMVFLAVVTSAVLSAEL